MMVLSSLAIFRVLNTGILILFELGRKVITGAGSTSVGIFGGEEPSTGRTGFSACPRCLKVTKPIPSANAEQTASILQAFPSDMAPFD